jgi:hypothetical protein
MMNQDLLGRLSGRWLTCDGPYSLSSREVPMDREFFIENIRELRSEPPVAFFVANCCILCRELLHSSS